MSRTIVITGGSGFVGRHLLAELTREEPDTNLIVWDRTVDNLPAGVAGVPVDITRPATYQESLARAQPHWLIHLAAITAVGDSWRDPDRTQAVNVTATEQLLKVLVATSPATKVLAVSSADIYGPIPDTAALLFELPLSAAHPVSPYGQSKAAMERVIEQGYSDRCLRVRPFPHVGPGQQRGFVVADFAAQIAAIEAGQQPPLIKVGNLEAARDFTDVRDVVRAYRLLLERGQLTEVYHVASGRATKIADLLQQLLQLSRVPITIEIDPARLRPTDIPMLVGDHTKLTQATGWTPAIPLTQTLQDILDDWRARLKWDRRHYPLLRP